jgi:hypothetical protein
MGATGQVQLVNHMLSSQTPELGDLDFVVQALTLELNAIRRAFNLHAPQETFAFSQISQWWFCFGCGFVSHFRPPSVLLSLENGISLALPDRYRN